MLEPPQLEAWKERVMNDLPSLAQRAEVETPRMVDEIASLVDAALEKGDAVILLDLADGELGDEIVDFADRMSNLF